MQDSTVRFESKYTIDAVSGCWEWQSTKDASGYGKFYADRSQHMAHRWSYQHHVGPIPDGLVIDHLCRNHACVNPEHLEPTTHRVNILRGTGYTARHAAQTHCINGHEFTEANTYYRKDGRGVRDCRTCRSEWVKRCRAKR